MFLPFRCVRLSYAFRLWWFALACSGAAGTVQQESQGCARGLPVLIWRKIAALCKMTFLLHGHERTRLGESVTTSSVPGSKKTAVCRYSGAGMIRMSWPRIVSHWINQGSEPVHKLRVV